MLTGGGGAGCVGGWAGTRSPRPPNLERIVELNRGPFVAAPEPLEERDALEPPILDVRPAELFGAGHALGAINVPLERKGFATKAAFVLLQDERPLILATSREQADDAARRLRAVGFGGLRGYVLHGPETETLRAVEVDELERLLAEDAVEIIDVRELHERDDGFIPGSRNIPYRLAREDGDELKEGRPGVAVRESGAPAAGAAR